LGLPVGVAVATTTRAWVGNSGRGVTLPSLDQLPFLFPSSCRDRATLYLFCLLFQDGEDYAKFNQRARKTGVSVSDPGRLPSEWAYRAGDLVVPNNAAFRRTYGIGIVLDRNGPWAPWPVFWFKDGALDSGWNWKRTGEDSLVRLSVFLERQKEEDTK